MAAGDFTLDSTTLRVVGDCYEIQGTVEVSTSAAQADIIPNGYIISFSIDGNQDDVDVAVPRVAINRSDFSGTVDNGSIYIDASGGAPDTLSFTCKYRA